MINEIQKSFTERIVEIDWLDSETKSRCVDKVHIHYYVASYIASH